MPTPKKPPLAQDTYDLLAEAYAARIDTKPHNAYYERPATLSLLPDVRGKRLLDAGCGPGVYAEWLVSHGAEVFAVDGNAKMVRLARQRLGDKVTVVQANLEEPLDFLERESFDMVICPLVMDYIEDWGPTFKEFHRLLRPAGCFVFSIGHPFYDYDLHRQTSNYFAVELVEFTWNGFGKPLTMPSYRRSMSQVINPLLQAGFILDQLLEPLPTGQFRQALPEDYDKLTKSPGFMCLRAFKA